MQEGQKYKQFILVKKFINRKKNVSWICKCTCGRNRNLTEKQLLKYVDQKKCKCPKKLGNKSKWWKGCGDISGYYFSNLKHSAKNRNIEFNITIQDIWNQYIKQDKKCAATNQYIYFVHSIKTGEKGTASVDRIDPKKSYTVDNIQIVNKQINSIKHTFSEQLYKYLAKKVTMHNA